MEQQATPVARQNQTFGIDAVEEVLASEGKAGTSLPDGDTCWEALGMHDPRLDGLFFVGVSTTGIYCRAVCSAKRPKRENCTFYRTAAEAEAAGFRPCLKCRPELAPGVPLAPDTDRAVRRAALLIKEGAGSNKVADIAAELGLSERQFRRLFERAFGVTPTEYRTTCRLLLAKSLLTDTDLPITRVAYACGFSSVRRFNDAFSARYRMPPTRFRVKAAYGNVRADSGPIVLHVGYRPPFRFDLLLDFLRMRAIEGVEAVSENAYLRTVRLDAGASDGVSRGDFPDRLHDAAAANAPLHGDARGVSREGAEADASLHDDAQGGSRGGDRSGGMRIGWIKVEDEPGKNRLSVTVSPELFDDLPLVLARVRRLFDTDCLPTSIEKGLEDFYARVAPENRIAGIRLPCCFDGFEMAVRAILGQQITVKAAGTLAGRVAREFGLPAQTPFDELGVAFPSPIAFCASDAANRLGELGVIRQRARAICALAEAVCSGDVGLCPGSDLEADAAALKAIPGIGDWTVQYLLMRAYAHPDAFPASDLGVLGAFPGAKPREVAALSEDWRPWRSYAVMSIWSAHAEKAAPRPSAASEPVSPSSGYPETVLIHPPATSEPAPLASEHPETVSHVSENPETVPPVSSKPDPGLPASENPETDRS
ncbi:DNA-3-methyladenine glycosylase 2 family protein [Raoultibacter phocaeensis]|uniref:DNA-3-methyladenine glycosylase 2 family protein n=1 Tax=Raoultibacter phocaeensis TaxID=2479841 RepID=UPI00111ADD32|nr:Ada metal-binding domain-containing protein [Raoultibacter phocaeensis]